MENLEEISLELLDTVEHLRRDRMGASELAKMLSRIDFPQKAPIPEPVEHNVQKYLDTIQYLNPSCTLLVAVADGTVMDADQAFFKLTGYDPKDIIGRSPSDLDICPDRNELARIRKRLTQTSQYTGGPVRLRLKSGDIHNFEGSARLLSSNGRKYALGVLFDESRQKILEEVLFYQERQLVKLADELNNLSTTVRVLADTWGKEKAAIDTRINNHINIHIRPHIDKIRNSNKKSDIQTYVQIIEDNLDSLAPSRPDKKPETVNTFTPSENKIFQLIRQGKSSKEIAELLNVSTKTISFHRSNIRKKLNIANKKINLTTYLFSQNGT